MNEIDPFKGLTSFPVPEASGSLDRSGLGRDAFLKIFLTQLANQDPEAPQDASELGAQLAIFSQVEQQTLMAEELRGVNSRLDQLLQALAKPTGAAALDPVSLIGKAVDLETSTLHTNATRSSTQELRFEVRDADVRDLLIEGESADDRTLGLAVLHVPAERPALERGEYALRFEDGKLVLELPDGSVLSGDALEFQPFVHDDATGQPIVVSPDTPDAPRLARIAPNLAHEVFVSTRNREGVYKPLETHVTGNVSAVHVVDGKQVVTVDGVDLDPAKIIRIR
jgi:hypothetical protein